MWWVDKRGSIGVGEGDLGDVIPSSTVYLC
jgi:hypothetical protein